MGRILTAWNLSGKSKLFAEVRIGAAIRRHPRASVAGAALVIGLSVFVLIWFQPQKLFLDQKVNEDVPQTGASMPVDPAGGTSPRARPQATSEPRILASGAFRSLEHRTTGSASVLELESGARILRFDELNTSNGPDLHVYLSEVPAGDDWRAYGVRYVDLGKLKGNIGSQNYALPDGLDLSRFKSAVVWCKRFAVGFGVAALPGLPSAGAHS